MEGSCNERMGDWGMGDGTLSTATAATLDPQTVALVRVAAAIATGDDKVLRDRMTAARGAGVPALWLEELLLQSLLNVGDPLTPAAFAAWGEVAEPVRDGSEPIAPPDWPQAVGSVA